MFKKLALFNLCFFISLVSYAITVNSTAGGLTTAITTTGQTIDTITSLTVTGTIDARDFKAMRDEMPALTSIDLSATTIAEYTGSEGTFGSFSMTYNAHTIPFEAFSQKTNLLSITLSTATVEIKDYAFENCIGLTSFTTPANVTAIGPGAFINCENLLSINIPTSVEGIGGVAFKNCSSLSSLDIPASVVNMGNSVFGGSKASITVDASNTQLYSADGVLFTKFGALLHCPTSKNGSYTIPSTVTVISNEAFRNCINLTSITIPSSVLQILNSTFDGCTGLSSISIPASVGYIDSYGFANCTNLTAINAYATTPIDFSFSTNVFYNVNKTTCVLHVPIGSKAAYEAADQWKDFTTIVEDLPTDVNNATNSNFKVGVQNGQAILSGVPTGETITVYTLQGSTIYNQTATYETVRVSLPTHDMYVVKVGSESIKVVY
ncbi:MAG: leucine-rich repeat domain-containing protein [Paludibacteraceae bacterium]|nr:leucine-rich repeat domain-containing protein [Paludibacteraceae bacterium]MBN2787984.1 leucine-rich repeat domain-containing protein [Paludibacteraceae bacterium]